MIDLKQVSHVSVERVGGKAFRLAALSQMGYRVKPAVILEVEDVETVRNGGFDFQSLCSKLPSSHSFAVRSSAVGEDGVLSWAGQFTTRLFVSRDELPDAVRTCAAATNAETVFAYAAKHDAPIPRLALIIQEMVPAQMAGVLFTNDPAHGTERMIIEVVEGVGEELVSGTREPRRYYLDRLMGEVVAVEGASHPELRSHQISQLAELGMRLREVFGCEQDIEWAIDDQGELFLLQCRDVTTRVDSAESVAHIAMQCCFEDLACEMQRLYECGISEFLDVLSDQNVAEILTPHPCRAAFGLFAYIFAHGEGAIRVGRTQMGYAIGDELARGFFQLVAGQPRCSLVHDALTYRIAGISIDEYLCLVRKYIALIVADPNLASYPEIMLYEQEPSDAFLVEVFGAERAPAISTAYQRFFTAFATVEERLANGEVASFIAGWCEQIKVLAMPGAEGGLSGLIARYREVCDALRTNACVMFVKVARVAFFAYARLKKLLGGLYPAALAEEYLQTLTSAASVERNPNLQFSLQLMGMRDGRVSLDDVIECFGHLSACQLEVSVPRYREQPQMLREMAERLKGDPMADYQRTTLESERLLETLCIDQSEHMGELRARVMSARLFLSFREVVKFEFLRGHDLVRRYAQQIGALLGWETDLIFHLDPLEVFRLEAEHMSLRERALEERSAWERYRQVYVPQIIFSDDLSGIGRPPLIMVGETLVGKGVTNFITEGNVVVVRDLREVDALQHLGPGSVLVTVTTDPAWTPLLSIVGRQGALVTEIGGTLAHAAVYAREVGIAAVLNVPGATTRLQTGMRVRVNGQTGTVEIL